MKEHVGGLLILATNAHRAGVVRPGIHRVALAIEWRHLDLFHLAAQVESSTRRQRVARLDDMKGTTHHPCEEERTNRRLHSNFSEEDAYHTSCKLELFASHAIDPAHRPIQQHELDVTRAARKLQLGDRPRNGCTNPAAACGHDADETTTTTSTIGRQSPYTIHWITKLQSV